MSQISFLGRMLAVLKFTGGLAGEHMLFWLEMGENYMNKHAFLNLRL